MFADLLANWREPRAHEWPVPPAVDGKKFPDFEKSEIDLLRLICGEGNLPMSELM